MAVDEPYDQSVLLRLTARQKEQLKLRAMQAGMDMNGYIRDKVFGTESEPTVSPRTYSNLESNLQTVQSALMASLDGNIDKARALLSGQKGATSGNHDK